MPLDVGFIGAGSVAIRHAETLRGIPDVRVTAVTDPSPEAASAFARASGARMVPDVDALLAEQPGAAYVCVPPFAHGAPEEALLRAGIPFFVEKPVSLDLATAERIAAAGPAGPHWWLAHLGTRPTARRRGLGGAVLEPGLRRCDAAGLPAATAVFTWAGVRFLRRFGFQVAAATRTADDALPLWVLLRPPGGDFSAPGVDPAGGRSYRG